jgi:hypothetical protein
MSSSFMPNKEEKSSGMNNENSSTRIITDEPITDALDFDIYSLTISSIIANSVPRFTVGIYGGWGTGKTTMMQMVQKHLCTKNTTEKYKNNILTIWFDSWRYENEQFSALVPFVRTIILHLEDHVEKLENEKSPKTVIFKNLRDKFRKVGLAIVQSSTATAEAGAASFQTDIGKAYDNYKSEGSFFKDGVRVQFYKHISDNIKEQLEKIRSEKDTENFRIVLFIDDLDRCTPERALEILESIKTFFDIEGIIYVIGMDPSTIDSIIQVKYGDSPKISGLDYMQKIVQLPFQIPVWSGEDLGRTIIKIANETGLPKDITDMMLEQEIKDLIINSAKLNPRNIKRFINSLVLSYSTSGKNIENIYNENLRNYIRETYLRSMIAIQTFYFRGEKWLRFLKMINNYHERIEFLTHFITVVKQISYQDLRDKIKDFPSRTLKIYNEIIGISDEELFAFLQEASISLLKIDKIENYLRAVDSKNIDTTTNIKIASYESIDKLRDGVESFNEYVQGSIIHLPYLELNKIFDKQEVNLSRADLSGANLTGAFLSGANLSKANLWKAELPGANLSGANLSEANLWEAELPGADLSGAELPGANLLAANLSKANLTGANLTGAFLSGANLSEAYISSSILIGIEPQDYESMTLNTKSNFKDAVCDNVDFIYYISNFTLPENIPNIVNDKKELKLKLERLGFQKQKVESILEISTLSD